MVAIFSQDRFEMTSELKKALIVSVVFHVGIALFGIVGLPYISTPPRIPQPIAVEIINEADITTTNKPPPEKKLKPVADKPKKAPKIEKKIEAPPKVDVKEPPKLKPIEKPVEEKPPEVKPKPKPKPKVPPLPTEVLKEEKPLEKKVEENPEKKKEEPKKEDVVQQERSLNDLLKNIQDNEEYSDEEGTDNVAESTPDAFFSDHITQNELGALSNQLIGCWQIPIGVKDVHNMLVNVRIWANQDRTVSRVEIKDKIRAAKDPAFRALAESAKRAVWDPACSPLDLPEGKHEIWKGQYIEVPFDPSHVT